MGESSEQNPQCQDPVMKDWIEKLAAMRICLNCHRKLLEHDRGYCPFCSSTKA